MLVDDVASDVCKIEQKMLVDDATSDICKALARGD
jgi:hypothetical protein